MREFRNFSLLRLAAPGTLALLMGGFGATVHAAPEADPVMKLLADKGMFNAAPSADATVPADLTTLKLKPNGLVDKVRDGASDMVITAMNFLGVPYRRGGTDESTGFDCSGFTRHVFERSLGLVLPRRADEQASAQGLLTVQRDELRPGDLVFFNTLRRTFSHVGIYVGDGKFIHAPRTGGKVRVEDMQMSYWKARFTGARRVEALAAKDGTYAAQR